MALQAQADPNVNTDILERAGGNLPGRTLSAQEKSSVTTSGRLPDNGGDGDPITTPEADAAAEELQQRVTDHEASLAAERARANQATAAAQAAQREAQQLRETVTLTRSQSIDKELASLETEAEALEAKVASAQAEGDYAAVAKATRRLGEIGADTSALKREKAAPAPVQQQQQIAQSDPKEQFLAACSPGVSRWFRGKPQVLDRYVTDQAYAKRLYNTSAYAEEKFGLDTPEFFNFVETEMGLKDATNGNGTGKPNGQNGLRKPPPTAASPSRSSSLSGRQDVRVGERHIPPEMRDQIDRLFGFTKPEEYASYYDNYVDQVRKGEIPDTFNVLRNN